MKAAKAVTAAPLFTKAAIDFYLQAKLEAGVAPSTVEKYRSYLYKLQNWLEENSASPQKLQEWRNYLENCGYGKTTVQSHVAAVNNFLRSSGYGDLCIPKPIRKDLAGKTFGYLTALEPVEERRHKYVVWRCVCKCGKEVEVPSNLLLSGNTASCGCLNLEILQHRNRYEEGTELRQAMEEKVFNPNSQSGYVGVQPKRDKWAAYITYKKKNYWLGTYSKLEDAVKARARAKEAVMEDAARIYAETDCFYKEEPHRFPPPEKESTPNTENSFFPAKRSDNSSGYPGVCRKNEKWAANITVKKYRYRLGVYSEYAEAVAARQRAESFVKTGDLEALKSISTNWPAPEREA